MNKSDKRGNTPLHLVCSHGFVDVSMLCIRHQTLLISCVCLLFSIQGVLPLLFRKELVNIASTNDDGDTPLHCAARWGYGEYISVYQSIPSDLGPHLILVNMVTMCAKNFSTMRSDGVISFALNCLIFSHKSSRKMHASFCLFIVTFFMVWYYKLEFCRPC